MELYHFFLFLLSIDERWLRPLQFWVPDWQQVLNSPAVVFQDREIDIGPWTRYVRSYVIPSMLAFPALIAILLAGNLAVTICVSLVWLIIAGSLVYASRGGSCL